MGTTVLLSQLPATTELLVINLVTQQDPESDPHFRAAATFATCCRAVQLFRRKGCALV